MIAELYVSELEREFEVSWLHTQLFYATNIIMFGMTYHTDFYKLISLLKSSGFPYNRRLRAGQSLTAFILSCSKTQGLADGEPYVAIDFLLDGGFSLRYFDGISTYTGAIPTLFESKFEINPVITDLLDRLLQHSTNYD